MNAYYRCTENLYSHVFKNLLKFSKDGVYECVGKNLYINNQGKEDLVSVEGWEKYFVPIDLEKVDIEELKELLEFELEELKI